MHDLSPLTGIARACAVIGSQRALAQELGITEMAVSHWVKAGFVPPDRAAVIEALSGVPRRELLDPKLVDAVDGDPLNYL